MLEGVNKKTIIQLVVILVAFGASGLVLYNGFFKGNGAPALPSSITMGIPGVPGDKSQEVLPYGDTPLETQFKVLDPKRFQYNQIEYEKLNPKKDVGISPESLIVPKPAAAPGGPPGQ